MRKRVKRPATRAKCPDPTDLCSQTSTKRILWQQHQHKQFWCPAPAASPPPLLEPEHRHPPRCRCICLQDCSAALPSPHRGQGRFVGTAGRAAAWSTGVENGPSLDTLSEGSVSAQFTRLICSQILLVRKCRNFKEKIQCKK